MRTDICLALLLTAAAGAQEAVVAHWPLDAVVDGTVADAAGELAGKLGGEPLPQPADGILGGALAFAPDGEGFVEVPKSPALDLTPPFTVAAWIHPEKNSPFQEIVCRRGDTEEAGWRLRVGWGILMFDLHDGIQRYSVQTEARQVELGFWTHVAAVHDGTRLTLFLNAEPVVWAEWPAVPKPSGRGAVIGNFVGRRNAYPFVGRIDDVWVLSEALDGEALYRLASGGM